MVTAEDKCATHCSSSNKVKETVNDDHVLQLAILHSKAQCHGTSTTLKVICAPSFLSKVHIDHQSEWQKAMQSKCDDC